ncbi:MAG: hypothetical protein ACK5M1_12735 [Xanthomarina gelatinilytica]|uniref:hypothetical protein n=1 Tax=Xanthomarina gelatinilytica TaxID=1137281 RepID=UPI003A849803
MKQMIYVSMVCMGILSLHACKSTDASLQRATATSIGNTLSNEIIVSNVNRSATNVSWDAKKNSECYKCEADDMVRSVNCKKN